MFFYIFWYFVLSFSISQEMGKCNANPMNHINDFFAKSINATEFGNIVILPLINEINNFKNISKLLQYLGLDKFPTIYPNKVTNVKESKPEPDCILPGIQFEEDYTCKHEKEMFGLKKSVSSVAKHDHALQQFFAGTTEKSENYGELGPGLLNVCTMPGPPIIRFWEAHKICTRHNMALPIFKNEVDYANFREILDADKEYWIGLIRRESAFPSNYRWMDGDINVDFLNLFADLRPMSGPAEYCTITLINGKSMVKVNCKAFFHKAHYVCAIQNWN